jgi:hypothetical protein
LMTGATIWDARYTATTSATAVVTR